MSSNTKNRINKRTKNVDKNKRKKFFKECYNGYLKNASTRGYIYKKLEA